MTVAAPPRLRQCDPPPRLPWLFRLFRWYAHRYAAKHLHAVRLSKAGALPDGLDGPLIIVPNHPSWWDPLLSFNLTSLLPDRVHWGPIDAAALRRYRFLGRAGLFGIELGTTRGASQFLRTSGRILTDSRAALWIFAQGRFADVRERPPRLRAGVGHLLQSIQSGHVLPLALEMTFWDERTPEGLARFGQPLRVGLHQDWNAEHWTTAVEDALARTQDALAAEAMRRDPDLFETIVPGRAGVGGVYDCWRRIRAWARGERFWPEHGD
jgi:1-acyl-sn-glycerol-3-phosphate acyltransferase